MKTAEVKLQIDRAGSPALAMLRRAVRVVMCGFGLTASLWAVQAQRSWTASPAPPAFEHLGTHQGLSQNKVYCSLQDRRGFLWFGTEDGLNRFDGSRFLVFRHEENAATLGGNWITCLHEDSEGFLWVGTMEGGLSRLDPVTLTVRNYLGARDGGLKAKSILSLEEDREGNLWIGTSDEGLHVLPRGMRSEASPKFVHFPANPEDPRAVPGDTVETLFRDGGGVLWAGFRQSGLCRIQTSAGLDQVRFERIRPAVSMPENILCIAEDEGGGLWLGGLKGLFRFLPARGELQKMPLGPKPAIVRRLYRDRAGQLWIGTDGMGLSLLLPRATPLEPPRFKRFGHDPNDSRSLSSDAVESIYEDRSGVLWVGTFSAGLNKLVLRTGDRTGRERPSLVRYQTQAGIASSLSGDLVNAVLEDHLGNLWVGTDGLGLNRAVPPRAPDVQLAFEHFRARPGVAGALPDDVITCLFEDSRQRLWAGSYTGGLIRVEARPGVPPRFTAYRRDPSRSGGIPSNFVTVIREDRAHRLWIGTVDGELSLFEPDSGSFTAFSENPSPQDGNTTAGSVYDIVEDTFGTLWLATYDGLVRFNPGTRTFQGFRPSKGEHPFFHSMVETLKIDRSNRLWVGTKGGGLAVAPIQPWNGPPMAFTRYTTDQGLSGNLVEGIHEDTQGRIWVATSHGLCRTQGSIPPPPGTQAFASVRELTQVEFIRNAGCLGRSGELLLGTTQGMVAFDPRDLAGNPVPPAVVLTDLKIFNRSVPVRPEGGAGTLLTRSITETREITLSHRDSAFSLEFAALHFVDPARNGYAYMLEGLDRSWNTSGTTGSVSYTTLPPGSYIFRLRAANSDGLWNQAGLALKIRVLPPWWQTWWMRAIEGLALLQGVLLALRWRMRRLRQRNQDLEGRVRQRTEALEAANLKLQEMDKLKENMAAMLVHDLRSPLTTIGFTLDLIEDSGTQDAPLLNRCRHSIHTMVAMLNDLLEVFRTQGGSMPLDVSPVFPLALGWAIRSAFHVQCESRQIHLEIDVPEGLPALEADEHKVERALSNLVSNAIKYTPAGGVITLRAWADLRGEGMGGGNGLVFEVQDTGAGIPEEDLPVIFDPYRQATRRDSNLGVGLGLAIVQRIMAAHGGRVSVVSEQGRGTTFTLFFPLPD